MKKRKVSAVTPGKPSKAAHDRTGKPRKGRKNPPITDAALMQGVVDAALGFMFVEALRKSGLREAVLEHLFPNTEAHPELCVCKGECACHHGLQIAGVPCPPECPNHGKRFDGCHRCDCTGESSAPSEPTQSTEATTE